MLSFLLNGNLELLLDDSLAAILECKHSVGLLHTVQVLGAGAEMQILCAFASLDLMFDMLAASNSLWNRGKRIFGGDVHEVAAGGMRTIIDRAFVPV